MFHDLARILLYKVDLLFCILCISTPFCSKQYQLSESCNDIISNLKIIQVCETFIRCFHLGIVYSTLVRTPFSEIGFRI